MNKKILAIILVIAFFVTGCNSKTPDTKTGDTGKKMPQKVSFEVKADKEVYNSKEDISLKINMVNSGEEPVCLVDEVEGNITITSATKNGEILETRNTEADYLESFTEILKSKLKPVVPGEVVEFHLKSEFDSGLNARVLRTTVPDKTTGMVTLYKVADAGEYEIEITYEYKAGASDACKNVLSGQTTKAKINFKVQ